MKRILALALFAALSFSLYAQSSECTPPPMRQDVVPSDYEKHIDKMLDGTGDINGAAKAMLDEIDKECNIRKGLIKYPINGKEVYMEPTSILSDLQGHRLDNSEPQDQYQEGQPKSSGTRQVRSWIDKEHFVVVTEPKPDGVNYISSYLKSNMSDDGKQADTTKAGLGSVSVWYSPMPIKVKEPQKVADVYEGSKGAIKFKVTDYLERYCLEGYKFKVSVGNPETLSAPQEVTTGSDGTAVLVLKGNKEGKTKVTVNFDIEDPASGSSLHYSYEMEVEVLPAEQWSYNLEVLDQMLQPFDYYYLTGTFKVVQDIDENNQPIWAIKECSDAVKTLLADHMESGTITYFTSQERGNRTAAENENNVNKGTGTSNGPYPVEASFMNPSDRSQGVVLAFNMQKVLQDTKAAEKQMKATEKRLKKDLRKMVLLMLTGRHQSFDFIGSSDPVYCLMAPLNEGSKSYNWNNETLLKMSGMPVPDMNAMQAGGEPQEPMPQMSQEEYEQNMREGMEKYFKEGNVVVIPNFYKLLFLNMGNLMLTEQMAMAKVAMGMSAQQAVDEMMGVQGTITFTREDE